MDMTQLDKKLLIHVAAELVIIGGVAFWLNSKISTKDSIIERQEKEIKDLQERLRKIEIFLQNATGGASPPPQTGPSKKKKKKEQSPTASEEEEFQTSEDHEIEI